MTNTGESDQDYTTNRILSGNQKALITFYTCKTCPRHYHTSSLSTIITHKQRHQTIPKQFSCAEDSLDTLKCDFCDFETDLKVLLNDHINKSHRKVTVGHNLARILYRNECVNCSLQTYSFIVYRLHKCKLLNKRKLKCHICLFTTKRLFTLKRHHLLKHQSRKPFACKSCPRRFKLAQNLQIHINGMHTASEKIKWFHCDHPDCTYKSKQSSNLKQHKISKHGTAKEIKWFQCTQCAYKSKQNGALRRHFSTKHDQNNRNKFKCDHCPYQAREKYHIKQHIKAKHEHHEIQWFHCDKCPYKGKQEILLKMHLLSKHDYKYE